MLQAAYRNSFKKDLQRLQKRGKDLEKLKEVLSLLMEEKKLPAKHKDHSLSGNYAGHRECHIEFK